MDISVRSKKTIASILAGISILISACSKPSSKTLNAINPGDKAAKATISSLAGENERARLDLMIRDLSELQELLIQLDRLVNMGKIADAKIMISAVEKVINDIEKTHGIKLTVEREQLDEVKVLILTKYKEI